MQVKHQAVPLNAHAKVVYVHIWKTTHSVERSAIKANSAKMEAIHILKIRIQQKLKPYTL